jgi:hypothetical protein
MRNILFILSLFYCSVGIAQEDNNKLFLLGKTYNQYNLLPYVNVHVKNKVGTSTNNSGNFSLQVDLGDTINFTHIGYKPVIIVVVDSNLKHELVVQLKKEATYLKEFSVTKALNYDEFKKVFIDLKLNDVATVNAKNNINLILLQGNTTPYLESSAQDNQRQSIKKYTNSLIYQNQISPENTLDIFRITSEIIELVKKKEE